MINKFLTYFSNKLLYLTCCLTLFCICNSDSYSQDYVSQQQIKKIVIDAGHGGKDPGAVGKKSKEKDITLSVALKLGELINKNYPKIQVIYTRNKDVFVELGERGNIANRNNADLFISIHVNSFKTSAPRGISTWVMGLHKSKANLDVAKLENSVITFEDDYTSKYQGFDPNSPESYIIFSLMQNVHIYESLKLAEMVQNELLNTGPVKGDKGVQQAGFLVLWKTAMPSILIELGFISNPNDEAILMQTENQTKMAKAIFNAFSKYKQEYEKNSESHLEPINEPADTADKKTDSTQNNTAANAEQNTTTDSVNKSQTANYKPDNTPQDTTKDKTPAKKDSIAQKNIETETTINNIATNNKPTENKPVETQKAQKYYSVQIMAINKLIPVTAKDFKGHKNVRYIKIGNYYKYITGEFNDINKARQLCRSLQTDFKGAFVVIVEGNTLTIAR